MSSRRAVGIEVGRRGRRRGSPGLAVLAGRAAAAVAGSASATAADLIMQPTRHTFFDQRADRLIQSKITPPLDPLALVARLIANLRTLAGTTGTPLDPRSSPFHFSLALLLSL